MSRPETDDPGQRPVRVFVVDDHTVVRRGLHAYLEMVDDMELIGEAAEGREALEGIAALVAAGRPPDVVLMDLLMPGMDGVTATAAITQRHPEMEAVAMTSFMPACPQIKTSLAHRTVLMVSQARRQIACWQQASSCCATLLSTGSDPRPRSGRSLVRAACGASGRGSRAPAASLSATMAQTRLPSQTLKGERWSSSRGLARGPFSSPSWSPWRSSQDSGS
jgi:CheY-like chemotaxis protein